MAKRKKTYDESKDEVQEEPIVKEEPKPVVVEEYILKKDLNLNIKKGDKVSKEKYKQLVGNGFGYLFE